MKPHPRTLVSAVVMPMLFCHRVNTTHSIRRQLGVPSGTEAAACFRVFCFTHQGPRVSSKLACDLLNPRTRSKDGSMASSFRWEAAVFCWKMPEQ